MKQGLAGGRLDDLFHVQFHRSLQETLFQGTNVTLTDLSHREETLITPRSTARTRRTLRVATTPSISISWIKPPPTASPTRSEPTSMMALAARFLSRGTAVYSVSYPDRNNELRRIISDPRATPAEMIPGMNRAPRPVPITAAGRVATVRVRPIRERTHGAEGGLHEEGQETGRGVEEGEETHERFSGGHRRRRLRLEDVVDEGSAHRAPEWIAAVDDEFVHKRKREAQGREVRLGGRRCGTRLWNLTGSFRVPQRSKKSTTPRQSLRAVYLDSASTTPLTPEVLDAMRPYLTEHFGNASSVHALGRTAKVALEKARDRVAAVLNCEPAEIVFTSGGTESDNAAIRGALSAAEKKGLVTSASEHEAVLRTAEALAAAGGEICFLVPDASGSVSAGQVAEALTSTSGLVSVMLVNNELGTVSPIREIADVAHTSGALIHTDAVQAAGSLSLDVEELDVDLLSLSGHKINGPKGIGVLYVRSGTPFAPHITGGAQERKRRGGTENVAGAAGFAEALVRTNSARQSESTRLTRLQRRLAERIRDALGIGVQFNTPLEGFHPNPQSAAPHILNISFPPANGRAIDGEMLLLGLDVAGVFVSSGSACTSGAIEPSHVLLAAGVPLETAAATVRFSLGKGTKPGDIDYAVDQLVDVVGRLRVS